MNLYFSAFRVSAIFFCWAFIIKTIDVAFLFLMGGFHWCDARVRNEMKDMNIDERTKKSVVDVLCFSTAINRSICGHTKILKWNLQRISIVEHLEAIEMYNPSSGLYTHTDSVKENEKLQNKRNAKILHSHTLIWDLFHTAILHAPYIFTSLIDMY